MYELLKKYRTPWLLGLYVLVAFGLVLAERRAEPGTLGAAGAFVFRGSAGVEDLIHTGSGGLGRFWDQYLDLVAVREENERLRRELDRVRDEHARLLGVMQENARLRALVGFADAYPTLELEPARVIAKDVTPFFRVITLRIDASGGRIDAGMPVVASAGVVGYVSEVSGRYAQVLLAVDPRSSIDVLVQRNRARGVLVGNGHDNDYTSSISYLLARDEVAPGDVVVTSGMGGRFPPDLVVGRIATVDEREAGIFQQVTVEPAVDFSRVEEVFVVVGDGRE